MHEEKKICLFGKKLVYLAWVLWWIGVALIGCSVSLLVLCGEFGVFVVIVLVCL